MQKVVVQILRAPAGGIGKHVFDIIESLASKNIKQIFITNTKGSDRELPQYDHLTLCHIDIKDQPHISDLTNILKIHKILKNHDVEVIHGHGAKGGMYARILSFLLPHKKCIYTPHGGSLHRAYGPLKNKLYSFIEWCLVPWTDVFLFESHYSHEEFSKNICPLKDKFVINYNGVDIPKMQATAFYEKGNTLRLASFGLLRSLKGHDIAIKACALLLQHNIPFEYAIYGEGEERDSLLKLIEIHNLHKKVTIKGHTSQVLREMLLYDFVFHPSRFESFGYVPVEAMSVKIPVITSSEGGLKEVVSPDCGYISLDNTPESYFEILKRIYEGDDSLAVKIEIGFSKVERVFSRKAMLGKIEEIYFRH